MSKEISRKEGVTIITQQSSQLLAAIIPAVLGLSVPLQAAFLTGSALIQTWGAWGQSRVSEVVDDLKKHETKFNPAVIESDEFKTVLLNILEVHMKEAAAEKRKLYRNYLINVAKGESIKIDYHSKLLAILNLITFDEIRALDKVVDAFDKTDFAMIPIASHRKRLTAEDICRTCGEIDTSGENARNLARNMRALQSYNLIFTGDAAETNTGLPTPGLEEVTEFARTLLRFINEPEVEADRHVATLNG